MRVLWCSLVLLLLSGCATYYTLDELEDQLMVCENTGAACDEERDRMRSREDAIERRANRDYCDPRNCVLRGDPDWERRMRDMLGGGRGW